MGRMEQTWVETIRTRMDFSWRERAQGPTSELGTCWEVHWFLGRIEPTKRGYEAAISEIHNLDTDLKMDELPWTFLKQPWTVSNDITMKIVFKVFIEDLCQGLNQTQNLRSYGYPPVTWHGHGKYPVWPDKKNMTIWYLFKFVVFFGKLLNYQRVNFIATEPFSSRHWWDPRWGYYVMTSKWPHSSGCGTILSSQNLAISHDTAVTSCAVLYAIWLVWVLIFCSWLCFDSSWHLSLCNWSEYFC